jgi:hypothetical protein
MDRRDFLRGTILATTAAASTALVKLASPAEVLALNVEKPVLLRTAITDTIRRSDASVGALVYIQTPHDGYQPIGVLTRMEVTRRAIDATMAGHGTVAAHFSGRELP